MARTNRPVGPIDLADIRHGDRVMLELADGTRLAGTVTYRSTTGPGRAPAVLVLFRVPGSTRPGETASVRVDTTTVTNALYAG